jgi:hypothetical protein
MRKLVLTFSRKFWFFFAGVLFFTAFFSILRDETGNRRPDDSDPRRARPQP